MTDTTGIVIAEGARGTPPDCVATLLPPGPASDRIAAQLLPPERRARLRKADPLRHHLEASGEATLSDANGLVLARERAEDLSDILDRSGRNLRPWSIEVADNYLPASWLFALIHARADLRGAFGRH